MKNICYGVVLCLILGACDKCRDMSCGGYGCNDGVCVCPEPFTGNQCSEHKYKDLAGVYRGDMEVNSNVVINQDGRHWIVEEYFMFDPETDSLTGYTFFQEHNEFMSYINLTTNQSGIEFRSKLNWRKGGNFDAVVLLSYYGRTDCEDIRITDEVRGVGQIDPDSKKLWFVLEHSSDYLFGQFGECEEVPFPATLHLHFTGTLD